jgi:hypothetical protein
MGKNKMGLKELRSGLDYSNSEFDPMEKGCSYHCNKNSCSV